MTIEIERTWFVAGDAPLAQAQTSVAIRQGYVAITNEAEVRVRAAGATCLLTVKTGRGQQRSEVELPITREQFEALWPATTDARLVKTRHVVRLGDHRAEVDVFEDSLAGLVLVEVEFDSTDTADAFEPPAWFGQEITDTDGWNNASLAVNGIPTER